MSLKDFVIMNKLGQGAYSSVFRVQRLADNQIYALKKVKMNNLSGKQQENALNEVRILASIKSPFVIGYKHAFIQANSLCIVMQFSDDGDLYQKIVQQKKDQNYFKEELIWKVLIQVLLGLETLHQLNILHRDLKSANVFLGKDGSAKLGDMNVSKIAKNGLLYTQTGTPYYASPQVWKDKPYDSKSDIWSLGCVIYQMATLKPPFRAEDMDGLYKKVIKGSYKPIGQQYSKALSKVIKQLLQVNPSNRPSAKHLLVELKQKVIQYGFSHENKTNSLLQTIRADKKLHYLTDRLPKSNYQNGHEHERGVSEKHGTKPKSNLSYNYSNVGQLNLPKLDRVIIKDRQRKAPLIRRPQNKYQQPGDILLKIEGRSNGNQQSRQLYSEDPAKKILGRDIQAQLRKIYNLKPNQKRIVKKSIDLPRLK